MIYPNAFDSPRKPNFHKRYPSWYSYSTIKVIKEKRKFHGLWKRHNNPIDYLTFKLLRGRSKFLIAEDYKNYIKDCESSINSNPKHLWQFVKSKKNSTASIDTLRVDDRIIASPNEICKTFSEYFFSVFNPRRIIPAHNATHQESHINISSYNIPFQSILQNLQNLPNKGADDLKIYHSISGVCEWNKLFFEEL